MHISLCLLLLVVSTIVLAQSTTSASSATPTITSSQNNDTRPFEERVSIAGAALNLAISLLKDRDGTLSIPGGDFAPANTPVLYSQLAEYDINTRNTTYKDLIKTQFPRAVSAGRSSSSEVFDHLSYGYAAAKAYVAYLDPSFLATAEQIWNFGRTFCISEEDIKSGKIATKTLPLISDCNGKSLLGGVFETTNATIKNELDELLDSTATGAFLILSALLAELTSNSTYIAAANQTLQFLKSYMYFPQSNDNSRENSIVAFQDDSRPRTIPCDDGDQPIWYPVTGNIIEGLSILASITGDADTLNFLHDTIISATDSREKQRPDHIIDMSSLSPGGFSTGDPFLVRGLSTAQKRNHTQGIEEDVKSFLEIQYNALLNNATFPGTNIYGGSWIGPPERKLDPIFQTYAALVLVQAITLANSTTDSSGGKNETTAPSISSVPPGPTTTNISQSPKSTNARTGAIAGGVVGGVVVIAALTGGVCLFYRRRKRRQELSEPLSSFTNVREMDAVNTDSYTWGSPGIIVGAPLSPQRAREEPSAVSGGEVLKSLSLGPEGGDTDGRLQAIPTAELARVLNARLQSENWRGDVESAPPSYPRSQFGSEDHGR